jgi:hypothetical protein
VVFQKLEIRFVFLGVGPVCVDNPPLSHSLLTFCLNKIFEITYSGNSELGQEIFSEKATAQFYNQNPFRAKFFK